MPKTTNKETKSFMSYDADVFKKVFYSQWLTIDGNNAIENFKLTMATVELLDVMDELKTAASTFYEARKTKAGMLRVDGDKTLRILSWVAEAYINQVYRKIQEEKQNATFAFGCAETKAQQDVAMNVLMDKMAEEKAIGMAVEASSIIRTLLTKEERQGILKEYKQLTKAKKRHAKIEEPIK